MPLRAGLIIPSSNRMVEMEMLRYYPSLVTPHVTRLRMTGNNRMPLDELLPKVTDAAAALDDAKCDVITFHCTANAMENGPQGEARIISALEAATRTKVSTTATAIRRAFEALGARRVVVITPYGDDHTEAERAFLEAIGLTVLSAVGHNLPGSDAYCSTPPSFWREKTLAAADPAADAYLLSCANISVFSVIKELESELSKPVISSNQAVLWDALSRIECRDRHGCPGRLFDCP